MLKKQVTPHEGWFNYLLQAFFEVLEVLFLSFISNMSFLRVGGFGVESCWYDACGDDHIRNDW